MLIVGQAAEMVVCRGGAVEAGRGGVAGVVEQEVAGQRAHRPLEVQAMPRRQLPRCRLARRHMHCKAAVPLSVLVRSRRVLAAARCPRRKQRNQQQEQKT